MFSVPISKMLWFYLKMGHAHFHPHSAHLIPHNHPPIGAYKLRRWENVIKETDKVHVTLLLFDSAIFQHIFHCQFSQEITTKRNESVTVHIVNVHRNSSKFINGWPTTRNRPANSRYRFIRYILPHTEKLFNN